MQKCLALIALSTLISISGLTAMNDNNTPLRQQDAQGHITDTEQQLLDARICAFTQNARVIMRNPQEQAYRIPTVDELDQENNQIKQTLQTIKSITRAEEERANEAAITQIYEEPVNVYDVLERSKQTCQAVNAVLKDLQTISDELNMRGGNNNNAPTPAPQEESTESIRAAFEQQARALQARLLNNPTQAYELLVQFFNTQHKGLATKTNGTGNTPLHEAINGLKQSNDPRILITITALLEAGVNKGVLNDAQKSPLDLALESGNELVIQLITTEAPTKETLTNLAFEHVENDPTLQELIDMLIA